MPKRKEEALRAMVAAATELKTTTVYDLTTTGLQQELWFSPFDQYVRSVSTTTGNYVHLLKFKFTLFGRLVFDAHGAGLSDWTRLPFRILVVRWKGPTPEAILDDIMNFSETTIGATIQSNLTVRQYELGAPVRADQESIVEVLYDKVFYSTDKPEGGTAFVHHEVEIDEEFITQHNYHKIIDIDDTTSPGVASAKGYWLRDMPLIWVQFPNGWGSNIPSPGVGIGGIITGMTNSLVMNM